MSKRKAIPISPEEMESIGNAIKNARKEKGLRQDELAELVGVSTQTISNWETGKYPPADSNISILASVLEQDPIFFTPLSQKKEEREWQELYRNNQKQISKRKRILKRLLPEFAECYGISIKYEEDGSAVFQWEGHDVTICECWEKLYPIAGELFKDLIQRYGEDHGYMAKYGEGRT